MIANNLRHIYQIFKFPKHYPDNYVDERLRIEYDEFISTLEVLYFDIWRRYDGHKAGYQQLYVEYEQVELGVEMIDPDTKAYLTKHTYLKQ